ncbi:MAG: FAD-dependent oxidoreductase [Nitrososphaerota archaeon]|nr:FAD-dependent oxidoreductase [Aigarchaeota archaeon]MDW8077143.1 FAD-dependent oxidoreductase [Nitrososphaerota archaeon]
MNSEKGVSRRAVVGTIAAGIVGLIVGGVVGSQAFPREKKVTETVTTTTTTTTEKTVIVGPPEPPFEEHDIVIVGAGMAGLTAAIAAYEAGVKDIVILEKGPTVYSCNSSVSGGAFYISTPEFPPQDYFKAVMRITYNKAVPELIEVLAEKSYETVLEWLPKVAGVKFLPKDKWLAANAPGVEGGGPALIGYMVNAVKARGIPILLETKVVALLVGLKGEVLGVRALTKDGYKDFRAKATILACGGFQANQEMLVNYVSPKVAYNAILRGLPYNTGDGHVMVSALRAKLVFMDQYHGATVQPETYANPGGFFSPGIIVNKHGKRFIDEGVATYVEAGKAALDQPEGLAYIILDANGLKRVSPWWMNYFLVQYKGKLTEANSIEELANKLGISVEGLSKTVEEFNRAVRDGYTEGITPPKSKNAYRIETPPFYGINYVCGITLTFGGPLTDKYGRVLDLEGTPIPRLYAVGELTGGFFFENYPGGGSLARCAVFGRIAGEHAASVVKS